MFSTPIWSNPDKILSFEIFRQTPNNKDKSSYEEDQQGTAIRYQVRDKTWLPQKGHSHLKYSHHIVCMQSLPISHMCCLLLSFKILIFFFIFLCENFQTRYVHTVHEFSYETTERAVRPSKNASYMIRAQCGPSSRRALVHRWTLDTRDHVIAPTRGHLVRLCQELAGFSFSSKGTRDAKFIKHEIESWSITHLGAGVVSIRTFVSLAPCSHNQLPNTLLCQPPFILLPFHRFVFSISPTHSRQDTSRP